MKAKDKLFRILGSASRLMDDISQTGSAPQESADAASASMKRVTDELGNEYLCPVKSLADQDFVSEGEKTQCINYDSLSRHPAIS